ncbi:HTH domain protein [Clostridium homopropionicum DSM 5847]|uniref:HTH domain protein n=1 Tax=Clostridium homopropionicum DSM 5847 TaxID=1121318 RepID=A0A0L6Z6S0_9CLOT|nr:YafY family protein [Clostridium homopropionicum]KOA18659.1 HTH domain protein [Clostridium homopropionicum DSM 5847]SFG51713.1 Predicted DNA-binding transcriptional regulator YafY, contains an HTH and WYL domains [Clostridium homopropionicum]
MQINRLLEIIYILLDKKIVTAKELSEHFEVSKRTIYRDIDTLSAAGIPIYTNKGKGGGISLLDNFVINKSMLSEKEQIDILSSLQGFNALNAVDVEPVLKKLSTMFHKKNTNWIEVDLTQWGSNSDNIDKFNLLKTAILNRNIVSFNYFSSYGKITERTIEPMKLLFKGQSWYVYGFCKDKGDFRIFKVTRMKNLSCSNETFIREVPKYSWSTTEDYNNKMIKVILKIEERMAYRIYDEFDEKDILKNLDGSFTVTMTFPEDEWVYGYVLSYGNYAEVLEPKYIREIIKRKFEEGLKKYL